MRINACVAGAVAAGLGASVALAQTSPDGHPVPRSSEEPLRILVFTRTAGYHHDSIPAGVEAIGALGREHGFEVESTDDSATFADDTLAAFDVVVFLSTTGDVLNDDQQAAFERYIGAGHGYVGIHAAADAEYDWPWYGDLVGAYFKDHPAQQEATVAVEDRDHPSTAHLPESWVRFDEWYDYQSDPRQRLPSEHDQNRPDPADGASGGADGASHRADGPGPGTPPEPRVRILARLITTSYQGSTMGEDHPIAWCHEYAGGRAWYTGGGHTVEAFSEPDFLRHIAGGILWAAGRE